MKLRDEGKLSLEDPVSKYVPELANLPYPTSDSQVLNIRHLLTHSEGFPEDNPWGDRQLAQPDKTMREWMRAGIPFSTSPGTAFEYSNYGFAILGQIVAKASGRPYEDYVRDNILRPLGMNSSTFEMSAVPHEHIALGYRREDNTWKPEPILAHGSFGAMGGLWTNAHDLARYVAFLMSAFPPRDEPDRGPIKRSSAREMQQLWRALAGFSFSSDCRWSTSDWIRWLWLWSRCLEGLPLCSRCRSRRRTARLRFADALAAGIRRRPDRQWPTRLTRDSTICSMTRLSALHRTGALQPRVVQPSQALLTAQSDVSQLIIKWDESLANRIAADNLFLDVAADVRAKSLEGVGRNSMALAGPLHQSIRKTHCVASGE